MSVPCSKCQEYAHNSHALRTQARTNPGIGRTTSHIEKRDFVHKYKAGIGECEANGCHYRVDPFLPNFCAFDMDHIVRQGKIAEISSMIHESRWKLEDIIVELKKCQMLCRNCHKVKTLQESESLSYLNDEPDFARHLKLIE